MSNTTTFRTALNGFNRQDVADYLESAAERFHTLKDEKNALEAKCAKLESASADCETLRGQLARSEAELAEVRDSEKRLLAQIEALKAENGRLSESLKSAESRSAESAAKADEYDTMCARLAALEVDASRRAVEIERNAEAQAEEIRQAARQEESAYRLRCEASARSFQSALNRVAVNAGLTVKLLNGELTQLGAALQNIISSLEETAAGLLPGDTAQPDVPEDSGAADSEETGAEA